MQLDSLYKLLRSDGSVIINKNLIFAIGLNETIIYSELVSKFNYFDEKGLLTEDGFYFNTVNDLYLDTGLKEKIQRECIKKLVQLNLIEYKLVGSPPKRYFKIIDDVGNLWITIQKGRQIREELEIKLRADLDTSKLRLIGGNESVK